jgi:hypothetical protein
MDNTYPIIPSKVDSNISLILESEARTYRLKITEGFNYWNQADVSDDIIGEIIESPNDKEI